MKYTLSILTLCGFLLTASGQNTGMKVNSGIYSVNGPVFETGFGVYVVLNDFSDKVEVLFSFDYNKAEISREDFISNCERFYFTAAGLYVFPVTEKLKFKPGLAISHENMRAIEGGDPSNWVSTYYAKHLGIGLMTNLQFQRIFKLPLNFDIFLTPTYLVNINVDNYPTRTNETYSTDLFVLNFQLGLAYVVK